MNGLTIGKVAKGTGLGIETIRFYEKEGLIDSPQRTQANYRIYPERAIARLRFIKHAKALGFTLKEIKELLSLTQNPQAQKSDVKDQVEAKITDIKKKISHLQKIQSILEALDDCCDGQGPTEECPIIKALEEGHEAADGTFCPDDCRSGQKPGGNKKQPQKKEQDHDLLFHDHSQN